MIPHYVILHTVLNVVASLTAIVAWVTVLATGKLPPGIAAFHATYVRYRARTLFTGRWPDGLFRFSAGWVRVDARLWAYSMLLTDEYPPFSID